MKRSKVKRGFLGWHKVTVTYKHLDTRSYK